MFFGKSAKDAVHFLRPSWAPAKAGIMGPKAVDALFPCNAVVYGMTSLATALADWLSMALAGKVVAPARFALLGYVSFV